MHPVPGNVSLKWILAIVATLAECSCTRTGRGTAKDIAESRKYYNETSLFSDVSTHASRLKTWLEWSTWSACDVTCGVRGTQERYKRCRQKRYGSDKCYGREITETRPCSVYSCPTSEENCETVGTVVDASGIPLSDVDIVLGTKVSQTFTILTRSNENGFFSLAGICANSSHAHLVALKANYKATRIRSLADGSGMAVAEVKLLREVKPTIYQHPENRARYTGQSVKFCCKARGSKQQLIYSWYHNDSLLDAALYARDPGFLEIRNLKLTDAGSYWCTARLFQSFKKTTGKSQKALLTVTASESDVCAIKPVANLISLPKECRGGGVATVNINDKNYIDIGRCISSICPTNHTGEGDGCGKTMKEVSCCGPVERDEITLDCGAFSLPIQRITKCGCQKCVKPAIKVRGRAYGKDVNDPLRYGIVERAQQRIAVTSYDGSFSVDVPHGTERLVLTFKDRFGKLITTTKTLILKKNGGVTYHGVKMKRKASHTVFNSRERLISPLSDVEGQEPVAQVITAPNSFFKKDGQRYTGKVKASVTFIDPRNESSYEESPTDLSYVNENGDSSSLQTFGMFEMDFRDDDMNELDIGKAKVVLDKNQFLSPTQAGKLKLWSLNPENGMWEEEEGFKEMAIEDEEIMPGPKRRKRETQTFFVGNLEIRERRLYNLDVPVENRCWIKVRAYRSPNFDPQEQVEGVEVTVINMDPATGFRGNPQAWGRFSSGLTTKDGTCVRAFCDGEKTDAYKAIVMAKLNGDEELYASASGFPLDPDIIGVRGDVLKKLEYRRSDHSLATGKKTTFQTNVARPKPDASLSGPIYPEKNYEECVTAPVTDNHFRFHRTEDFLYEYNTIFMDEHNCITWTPHYLNWWPKPLVYKACYIKVHINSASTTVVRVKSFGGIHVETKGRLYGIRDDRSVKDKSEDDDFSYSSAACVELKCSGLLFDMEEPDRTLVSVVPQGECYLHRINGMLTQYLTRNPPAVEGETASEFRFYAPADSLDGNYGIYTSTEDDPLIAKKIALGRCYAGSSDVTSRIMRADTGVAVYYRCRDRNKDDELP